MAHENIDARRTTDMIERMKLARIGDYTRWEMMLARIEDGQMLDYEDLLYIKSMAGTYRDGKVRARTRFYHRPIDAADSVPSCIECGKKSAFFCVMNDAYYCQKHIIGHDENEI